MNLLLGLMMMMNSLSLGQQLNNFRFRIKCKTHYKAYHVGMGRKETVFCLNCVSSLRSETNRSNSKVPLDLHPIDIDTTSKEFVKKRAYFLFASTVDHLNLIRLRLALCFECFLEAAESQIDGKFEMFTNASKLAVV